MSLLFRIHRHLLPLISAQIARLKSDRDPNLNITYGLAISFALPLRPKCIRRPEPTDTSLKTPTFIPGLFTHYLVGDQRVSGLAVSLIRASPSLSPLHLSRHPPWLPLLTLSKPAASCIQFNQPRRLAIHGSFLLLRVASVMFRMGVMRDFVGLWAGGWFRDLRQVR